MTALVVVSAPWRARPYTHQCASLAEARRCARSMQRMRCRPVIERADGRLEA